METLQKCRAAMSAPRSFLAWLLVLLAAWLAMPAAFASFPSIPPGQTFTVSENLPGGTVVGTVQATDPEGDPLFYFIAGLVANGSSWNTQPLPFELDPNTGVLRTRSMLNREHRQIWTLNIGVTDGAGAPGATETIEIQVSDVANESVVQPGGETWGEHPDYIGRELVLTMGASSLGPLDETRPVEFSITMPPGVIFLSTDKEEGWQCEFEAPVLICARDGIPVGLSPQFDVHLLLPSVPALFPIPFTITSGEYVHWDGAVPQFETWPHPSPADLSISLAQSGPSAELGMPYTYSLQVSDLTDPDLPALGFIEVMFDIDKSWGALSVAAPSRTWLCAQKTSLLRCTLPGMHRGDSAPPIDVTATAPIQGGVLPLKAWVSGQPDANTQNNVVTGSTLVQRRPSIWDQPFNVHESSPVGSTFGPVQADDDLVPAGTGLTFSNNGALKEVPFTVQPDGTLVQTGPVAVGDKYALPVRVVDGGGLDATANMVFYVVSCVAGDLDHDGICDDVDPDDDGDSVNDVDDNCPLTPNPGQGDLDHDGLGDECDADDDGDGLTDEHDPCPRDPANLCACTTEDPDIDGDGLCNSTDPDDDNDGIPDASDPCPQDASNSCGSPGDTDSDGDSVPDVTDNCPTVANPGQEDTDGDGEGDACDRDDDGDGMLDEDDPCPLDPANACNCSAQNPDTDGDGLCDSTDTDDDGDGIPDGSDPCPLDSQNACACSAQNPDTDGDGQCDSVDTDDDGDGIPDSSDPCPLDPTNACTCPAQDPDSDGDGLCNSIDPDDDGDGLPDASDPCPTDPLNGCVCPAQDPDIDGDGQCNSTDTDDDGDGMPDASDPCPTDPLNGCVCPAQDPDMDGDGLCNGVDTDDDGDGIPDASDLCPLDAANTCGGRIFKNGFEAG